MLETRSKNERETMSVTAQLTMRSYAANRWPLMNHKGRIARLAQVLGLGHRRVRSIYQNEPSARLRADEAAKIEALNAAADEENRNEFQALEARLARLEAALFATDEEFHREQMAAIRAAVDGRRGNDEPRTTLNND